ncbi:hypothetical protein KIW_06745 [Pediococcus acidilactici MA18/5M]|uniref:Uncharacterized protein n=1 Tax=Pediococcus acidilactici DSM 20284 TaxID=862514 RepID=E0NFZ9_PEDAC|nr:hypothetical protein HMPREF0623_0754 [Pediococcus acidilactici DSM 20284]EHJ20133.1 hypothetical protein KIW_06745 [Pediococcus acidilactici MA18/5M]
MGAPNIAHGLMDPQSLPFVRRVEKQGGNAINFRPWEWCLVIILGRKFFCLKEELK